jgi:hypothetical protein
MIVQAINRTRAIVRRLRADGEVQQPGAVLQAQLDYLEHGLSAMDSHQSKGLRDAERSTYATEESLEGVNARLHGLTESKSRIIHNPISRLLRWMDEVWKLRSVI